MPYFYDPNLDQDKQQEQASNGQSVNISGASQAYNQNGTPQQSNNNSKDLNTGSGFQNLDKYLQVNNAQDFGNQFQGKVKDQINSVQNDMNQASDQFKDQVSSLNQTPTSEQVNQAISDPTHADPTQFQGWEKQTYQGPHSLAENQDLWNKYWSGVNQAQTNTQMLGTDAGRFTLLDQYFGRPTYNFGEKSLDNLLYQESGLGSQTKALQDQATQLKTQGNQGDVDLQNYAAQKASQVDQSRQGVRGAIGLDDQGNVIQGDKAGAIGKQYDEVEKQLSAANAARAQELDTLKQDLARGQLSDDELAKTGLSTGQKFYNLDLNNYVNGGGDLNRNQTMTSDQRAYIRALSELSGITDTFANGEAESANDDYTFDKGRFLSNVNSLASTYNDRAKDVFRQFFPEFNPSDTPNFDDPDASKNIIDSLRSYNDRPGITASQRQANQAQLDKYLGYVSAITSLRNSYKPTSTVQGYSALNDMILRPRGPMIRPGG